MHPSYHPYQFDKASEVLITKLSFYRLFGTGRFYTFVKPFTLLLILSLPRRKKKKSDFNPTRTSIQYASSLAWLVDPKHELGITTGREGGWREMEEVSVRWAVEMWGKIISLR